MERSATELPTRVERTTLYESPWVTLHRDRVALPNGHLIEGYHVVDFGHGAVAVIVENDDGDILMESVARYPTQTISWELPAGSIEENESALEAAKREVAEETGYQTENHSLIYSYNPLNGISTVTVHVVRCTARRRVSDIDTNEIRSVRWFSEIELKAAIRAGAITDGLALIGLLLHLNRTSLEFGS